MGTSGGAKLARGDRKFIENAAVGSLKEVELGRLAAQKATDPAVKSFGEQMVKDHGEASQKLSSVAQAKGVTPPTALKGSDERELRKLEKLSGADFDKAYVKAMMKDHQKDAKDFDKEARGAKDPDVKKFAADTSPIIHKHLDMITDLSNKVGRGGNAATSGATSPTAGAAGTGTGTAATGTRAAGTGTSAAATGSTAAGTGTGTSSSARRSGTASGGTSGGGASTGAAASSGGATGSTSGQSTGK